MTAWTDFVSEHRKKHPTLSYKQALMDCKPLYGKQHGRGVISDLQIQPKVPVNMTKMIRLLKKHRKEPV